MIQEPYPVEPNAQFETLDLMEAVDEEIFVGFIDVLVRLSCHGKNIMSQFQRRMDSRGKEIIGKEEGMYHSDVAPLEPVISTLEVSEGLVIGMLPTTKPVKCAQDRVKNPSPEITDVFSSRDILYEINQHMKTDKVVEEKEDSESRDSLRPCVKSFTPIEEKVKRFLASDPPGFTPYVKEMSSILKTPEPLTQAAKHTKNPVQYRRNLNKPLKKIPEEDREDNQSDNIEENQMKNLCEDINDCRPHPEETQVYNMTLGKTIAPTQFVCQGGGCKDFIKKRKRDCCRATSCVEGVSCIPVPPCMQFNPCEYPKCLGAKPPGFTPCYLPPCPADQLCKPCKQSPWLSTVPGRAKKSRKKRHGQTTSTSNIEQEKAETTDDDQETEAKDKSSANVMPSRSSSRKKKSKSKRRRKKCGGVCMSRGLDRYYNPRFRQGHRACVPDLETPPGVPPNMGWLWTVPNPGISPRPGWRPGAVHKKVFEIMCQLKDSNESQNTDKKNKDLKTNNKRARSTTVNVAKIEQPYVDIRKPKKSNVKVNNTSTKDQNTTNSLFENEDLKTREVLLQKTLTEVCKELCLTAYSDLFASITTDDLEQPSMNIRSLAGNEEFDFTPYAIKTKRTRDKPKSYRKSSSNFNQNKVSKNRKHCKHEKEISERDSYVLQKEQLLTHGLNFEAEKSHEHVVCEHVKTEDNENSCEHNKETHEHKKESKHHHGEEENCKHSKETHENKKDTCERAQKTCEHSKECDHHHDHSASCKHTCHHKELSTGGTYSDLASLLTDASSPTFCNKHHTEDSSVLTSGTLTSVVPSTTATSLKGGQDHNSTPTMNALVLRNEHKHHCKNKNNNDRDMQLYGELDRIMRIRDQTDACKLLMRKYIEDMETARIAREQKFGAHKANLAITAGLKNISDDSNNIQGTETSRKKSATKPASTSRNKIEPVQQTSRSKVETKKSNNSKSRIPVNSKVSSWLTKQPIHKKSGLSFNKDETNEIATGTSKNTSQY